MKTTLLKYLSVALASTLKFFGGPIAGVVLKLTWLETAICSAIGMMFSVFVLTYVGGAIQDFIKKRRKTPPKKFSRTNRIAVNIWKRFGIIGIAFLTPPLFTPLFGPILAVAFKVPRPAIFLWMSASAIIWGLAISYIAHKMTFVQEWIK
ncbi:MULTISPECIES: hypothetical protein [Dyadobacter]|uniref:Membrane protein YqaA with SNARE-associated domain n=1 Tax=Dyadobacter chenhuakuii TaxID=2909339 RepID=A0A9X1QDB0_9BACT|nr:MULTISPECIES: hypothetical protein [Dyadobacter]MCF2495807.1 hypothetical protein [Dyadobacter chenhuakuii]MCF2499753.1 hypothetical protein [Dyadobacter chenhuakuii]MCF2520978.1 hypothetical protein [Dyadobacter sp. CY351]USJ29838.1 hypothetical protein NFI80_18375 [Dyadobacter chenhuakuii]